MTRTAIGFSIRPKGMLKRQYGSHYAGVCHTALPQKGHTRPGEILFGTDSHTCMAGAFNEFATGIGNTDAGFVMGTGKLLIKVPETMHFRLEGKLQPGVMAKDIILHCIGEIGFDGATYRAMQFDGPGVASLRMDDRMTIANMAIEAGGKNGIFEFDAQTQGVRRLPLQTERHQGDLRTGRARSRTRNSFTNWSSTFASSNRPWRAILIPASARWRRNWATSNSTAPTSVPAPAARRAISSNSRACCSGKRVTIDTFGVPATPEIVHDLQTARWGEKTVWEILVDAGVQMTENAGCAACLGGPVDTFGRMNAPLKCISATNRNFPGRMGHKESQVFLASPATVAASAMTGRSLIRAN